MTRYELHRRDGSVISAGADLRGAVIDAVAQGTDLRYSALRRAELCGAKLADAKLDGADLTGATGGPASDVAHAAEAERPAKIP